MKNKFLKLMALFVASAFVGNAGAQTDVTSTYLKNADFSQGTPASVGICTYDYDRDKNGTNLFGLVSVEMWDCASNENGKAGGLVAFNSGVWIGGAGYTAPNTNSDGESTGNILGLVAVWSGTAQYTQNVKLPAGDYTLVVPVYNSKGGSVGFSKNLIGFIEDNGTEHLATNKTYAVNSWKYEFITFTLAKETVGKVSLGYTSAGKGSADMPHLFISAISLFNGQVNAADYEAAKEAARNEKEVALNKEKLSGSSYATPSTDLLVNGSFDTANQGWTLTNMKYQQNGERPTRYVEQWANNTSVGTGSATQTIKNLPAGAYRLVGMANAQFQTNQSLEITGVVLKINDSSYPVSGAWKEYDIVYNHQTDGDLTITFSFESTNANWVCVDGFSLVYGGDYVVYEAAMHKGDWDAALKEAQEALDSYKNVTGEERAALVAETEKVEPTTAAGYDEARDALKNVTNTFVAAAASYDAFVGNCEMASQYNLAYASEASKAALDAACEAQPTNAANAATKADNVIKALRAYIESHGMAKGVVDAVDMTSSITNASEPTNNDGWTISGKINDPKNNEPWTDASGINTHSYFDGGDWGANSWTTTMTQDVTIPAGKYLLSAIGRASSNVTFMMSVGDEKVNLPNVGAAGNVFDRGWNDASLEFVTPGKAKEETVTITVSASTGALHEWFSIGRFRLVQLEATEILNASEEEYEALASAIEAAEQYTLGFEQGEYAPYNNVDALTALAAAKAINVDEDNTSELVNERTAALNNAVWTANTDEVNAVANEHFATPSDESAANFHLTGWVRTNSWGQWRKDVATEQGTGYYNQPGSLLYGKSTLTGYTMPLKANTVYNLSFKYGSWEWNSVTITASVLNDSNEGLSAVSSDATSAKYSEVMQEKTFAFKTGAAGNYVLTLANNANAVITDVVIKQAPVVEATMSISDAKYSTFIAPFDVELPEGVTASKITGVVGNVLTEEAVEGTIPANTPVVLYSEAPVNQTFSGQSMATADAYTVGLLTGTYVDYQTTANTNTFVLQNHNDKVAFYLVGESAQPWIRANHCYMVYEAAAGAPMFSLERGEGTTSIEDAELTIDNVVIYDLAGRRVEKMEKGIYIVNGRKVVR